MSRETVRTHVIIPRELVDAVDGLVGRRGRSKFIAEAVEDKMAHIRLAQAAKKAAGSLVDVYIPGWETSEAAAEWVRASRRADEEKLHRIQEAD
jgi:metal-responsive CopG/Arc/MetJ family transcriptional regulator